MRTQRSNALHTVYLNGDFIPLEEARISPMDRGFLFGDGIYEVIPSYDGRLVGFGPHLARMSDGLASLEIDPGMNEADWRAIANELIARNGGGDIALYFHVSRGADRRRDHAYPEDIAPTIYAFAYPIPPAPAADKESATLYRVSTAEDMRWKRCNIKSTALLGNVMHYQQGKSSGSDETILYNADGEVTEAAACNVFAVAGGTVATPQLDEQKLPGITRQMLLDILKKHTDLNVEERVLTVSELRAAEEVWLTSSSKEVVPVVALDGKPVGNGEAGDVWLQAQSAFARHKFDY